MLVLGLVLLALGCGLAALAYAALTSSSVPSARDTQNLWTGAGLAGVGLLALLLSVLAQPARAAVAVCGKTSDMVAFLADQHGQAEIGSGTIGPDMILRIFSARDGRSFTIVTSDVGGTTCLLVFGENLDLFPPAAAPALEREG